jgi:uncharacterized protein (DUF952 family)
MTTIYKICPVARWRAAESDGTFRGSGIDIEDGFIHFSTGPQVADTASRHFANQKDLVIVAIDGARLGAALKWEPARSGDLFPHLYEPLDLAAVLWVEDLPLGPDGHHRLPVLVK